MGRHFPMPFVPATLLALVAVTAIGAPWLAPHSPFHGTLRDALVAPIWMESGDPNFLLGTDHLGRDLASRLIHGARVSMSVALVTMGIAGLVGLILGMLAGYHGGKIDALIMRIVDATLAFPVILLAIATAVVFGGSFRNLVIILGIVVWPRIARQIRAEALRLRGSDFVRYSASCGVRSPAIIIRHVLPNVLPTLTVVLTFEIGYVVLVESALSFLGAGIPSPEPSWGRMVAEGQGLMATGWWMALFPGAAITVTVLSINLLGDWLRDLLDPQLRQVSL